MKKHTGLLLASLMLVTPLAGCSDAQANLKDGSTVLMTVGKEKITKEKLFQLMNSTSGASTVISNATRAISEQEVEITDDMKSNAQNTLDSYKSMYGDTFTTYLEQNNMSEDDYLNKNLIPSLQAEKLTALYIEQNWDDVMKLYEPVMATVLEFDNKDDAQAALSELNDGSKTPKEAASEHNSTSSGDSELVTIDDTDLDSTAHSVITGGTPEDGWSLVPTTSGDKVYLIRVDDNNPENYRDQVIETLSGKSNVSSDATTYFFKKYGFHIYDITVYNAVAADYPDYLVQNIKDDSTASE
ncbi:MAG: hypothetical protein ACI32N_02505 [Bulleidia sp.]